MPAANKQYIKSGAGGLQRIMYLVAKTLTVDMNAAPKSRPPRFVNRGN